LSGGFGQFSRKSLVPTLATLGLLLFGALFGETLRDPDREILQLLVGRCRRPPQWSELAALSHELNRSIHQLRSLNVSPTLVPQIIVEARQLTAAMEIKREAAIAGPQGLAGVGLRHFNFGFLIGSGINRIIKLCWRFTNL
jgi:hypothetical protein